MATFTTTAKHALRWLTGANVGSDIDAGFQALAEDLDSKIVAYSSGPLGSRPTSTLGSPGVAGRQYYATDVRVLYLDVGTAWLGLNEPLGSIQEYAGASDPADTSWLLCDGRAISRITYAALFDVTGTAFGSGDGTNTFNLPDHRGRASVGPDNMGTAAGVANRIPNSNRARGQSGGEERHVLTPAEGPIRNHAHVPPGPNALFDTVNNTGTGPNAATSPYGQNSGVAATGNPVGGEQNGAAHNIMQPYVVTNRIIRVA